MFHARWLFVCLVLAMGADTGFAQPPAFKETIIKFDVQPAAAPVPALKYQLLPELKEMNPGNPIQGYMKCFGEQRFFFYDKDSVKKREKYLTMPLAELPLKEIRGYGGIALRNADYAARLDLPDWQMLLEAKRDGIGMLLPDIQQMRDLSDALKVRFRSEIAEHRFDAAIITAKTMFALSRHMGEHPTLIGNLVGRYIAQITLETVEEMIQQPGCPNLYWALTALPEPFIDYRKGLQGERLLVEVEFTGLDSEAAMSEAQIHKVVTRLNKTFDFIVDGTKRPKTDLPAWLKELAADADHLRAAHERLITAGLVKKNVAEFPAQQVLLLDEKRSMEVRRDESLKWFTLPYWQGEAGLRAIADSKLANVFPFWHLFTFQFANARKGQAQTEQRIAMLRHVEALRLHAVDNGGKLPESLDKLKVPLPIDPLTGKSFSYKLDGSTATLVGAPLPGETSNETRNLKFVVTVRK